MKIAAFVFNGSQERRRTGMNAISISAKSGYIPHDQANYEDYAFNRRRSARKIEKPRQPVDAVGFISGDQSRLRPQ
jgi:hypothetical protein